MAILAPATTPRALFDLDDQDLKGYNILIHGINASGKTHLIGDFLATEKANGSVRFINVRGEDGMLTLKGMGLGKVGETIGSYDEMEQALDDCRKTGIHACGIDSLAPLNSWARVKSFKTDRMPSSPDEWTELHRLMNNIMFKAKGSVKLLMCSCPSDRSVDQVTQKTYVTPDLPGKEARSSAGWFDFVGYLSAEATTPTTVKRTLLMAPNGTITVRQRLPKQITSAIELPNGLGGWLAVRKAIEAGMGK